jgi:hypothetical protein
LIGFDIGSRRFDLEAHARTEVPPALSRVSPIALYCPDSCLAEVDQAQLPWDPDSTQTVSFSFNQDALDATAPGNPIVNEGFLTVALPGVDAGSFAPYLGCDPSRPPYGSCNSQQAQSMTTTIDAASCNAGAVDSTNSYPRLTGVDPASLLNALQAPGVQDVPHLVPIYDCAVKGDASNFTWIHVIGWASYSFEASASGNDIVLSGRFHRLFLESSLVSGSDQLQPGGNDFGVRAVALSK